MPVQNGQSGSVFWFRGVIDLSLLLLSSQASRSEGVDSTYLPILDYYSVVEESMVSSCKMIASFLMHDLVVKCCP